ncbi:MAG TPA: hypothetical protein VJP85_01260 [Candidatus Baltobacteraceae bacterium]|nr:hypothetical protein [Candidatus Baltobacteraceae bacterium]
MMVVLALITLMLAPWRGPSLPTISPAAAAKYKLTVHGPPEHAVRLHANGLPHGWVAAFCTGTLCSPFRYTMELNDRGIGVVEFQAIRTDENAPKHVEMTVTADGAKSLEVRV